MRPCRLFFNIASLRCNKSYSLLIFPFLKRRSEDIYALSWGLVYEFFSVLLRMLDYLRKSFKKWILINNKTIANVKMEQCEGVCAYWGNGNCLVWSKIFRNANFLPSDNIRPKSESIGYIIRCTFENYLKPWALILL